MKATPLRLYEQAARLMDDGNRAGAIIRLRLAIGMIENTGTEQHAREKIEDLLSRITGADKATLGESHNLAALLGSKP